jgi:hypothetical protein
LQGSRDEIPGMFGYSLASAFAPTTVFEQP